METIIQHAFNILHCIYQAVHSLQKFVNSQNNDTNEDTPIPIIRINNLIELINWIRNVFNPSISLLKSYISNDKSNDWYHIIRLIELLINYLEQLSSSLSSKKSNHNDVHDDNDDDIMSYKFILSNCWLLIGFLYLRCNCPYSPLDPYIVLQVEEEAVKLEVRNHLCFNFTSDLVLFSLSLHAHNNCDSKNGFAISCMDLFISDCYIRTNHELRCHFLDI